MAEIYSIVYKPRGAADLTDRFLRVPLPEARLLAGYGIEGDRKGGHPRRQLNIMAYETVADLRARGYKAGPGELGEQIIVRGLAVDDLPAGTQLRIGDSARVEVVEPRTGCDRFEAIQSKQRTDAARQMGVIARVIADGTIHVGDPVVVTTAETER